MRTVRIPKNTNMGVVVQVESPNFKLEDFLLAIEKSAIIDALDDTQGNKSQAAKLLGLNRTTLVMKIQRHGITNVNFQNAVV